MNVVGGTVVQNGESDIIHVGKGDSQGDGGGVTDTNFVLNGGTLVVAGPSGFNGTIGPIQSSAPNVPAFGFLAEVDIQQAFEVASATFDVSNGNLSLLDSAGNDVGNIRFGGDASGLHLDVNRQTGVLSMHDTSVQASTGNIPLTFG